MKPSNQIPMDILESKFKHSKHLTRYLETSDEFSNYFESKLEFESAVEKFFDVSDEELIALSLLGYPINGRIFFDHDVLARIIQTLPGFMLSLLKEGNSLLFTIFQFQTKRPHQGVSIEYPSIRHISENVFYIWKAISDIEISDSTEEEKKEQLTWLPTILEFNHLHYDLMGCFQMNLMSQFMYLDARGLNIDPGNNPSIYPDHEKLELLYEIVGYLALPIKIADHLQLDNDIFSDLRTVMNRKINESGFIQNIHNAFENRSSLPNLIDGTQKIEQLEKIDSLFRLNGDFWEIKYDGETTHLKDSKGLGYIHRLIVNCSHPIRADVLVATENSLEITDGLILPDLEHKQRDRDYSEVHESGPRAEYDVYRGALSDLEDKLESYPIDGDDYSETDQKIKDLKKVISKTFNFRGEVRPSADNGDKARQAVTKAIKRDIRRILDTLPSLGNHLKQNLTTGFESHYDPPPDQLPDWQL